MSKSDLTVHGGTIILNDNRKDKTMNIKQNIASTIAFAVVGMTSITLADTPTITGVMAQQRYPWNGKVDISYTVTGDIAAEAKQRAVFTSLKVTAIDRIANTTNTATQLSGDLSLEAGTHAIVWDMDAEGFPLPFKSSNVVFTVSCEITPAMYCVIDLSAGANAASYPVMYLAEPPSGGFNVDEYKTNKLVLRRIEAGTFIMGDDQTDESHRVTLTKPFFCGLFEMTQRQYELVTGSNPCSSTKHGKGNTYPVHYISYNMIRGTSNGSDWPLSSTVDASSFMGMLRARTGLDFDIPTEAQWEYACRAGTPTTYNYGDSADGNYMWYTGNSGAKTHPVGTKNANAWGIYDMHGNVWEWCLDWRGDLAYGTDPNGPSSGESRMKRGGSWGDETYGCASFYRTSDSPSGDYYPNCLGFRLVRTLLNIENEQTVDVLCSGESKVRYIGPTAISSVTAQQRYPWNGKVDISYTVTGDIAAEAKQRAVFASLKVSAIDMIADTTNIATQLSGDLSLAEGTHAIVWDMDAEGFRLPFKSSNVVFTVSCEITPTMYCVIDLSAGANAASYPVTYLAEPPSGGFNVDEYKTNKLVLRRIEAGTFIMGDDQADESHRVTLTKPFFCGLFEVTQKQYSLIVGVNPSHYSGDKRPVECVSYNAIRGTSNGAKWPASSAVDATSFMGKLRARTGFVFDLPTEAQWEYVCRAGTTTTYSYGNSENGSYMWYKSNSGSQTHEVGTKTPNPWGLYDIHGNVWEWCLDWYASSLSGGIDPNGSSSGSDRVIRGGAWNGNASYCPSSRRRYDVPSTGYDCHGFRLVRTLSSADDEQSLDMLCSGVSKVEYIDLTSDIRMVALTERIYYSSDWESGAGAGASTVVLVNGEMLNSATGSGYVDWTPMSNGTYTLTHKVMSGGEQIGETLTATFYAVVFTATQTTEVPVPYSWLRQYWPGISDEYDAYESAALGTATNGRNKVWECYVVGISPTNETAKFTAAIEMAGGVPQITWSPNLNTNGIERTYTIWGKTNLVDEAEWECPTNSAHRFFKVKVEMP